MLLDLSGLCIWYHRNAPVIWNLSLALAQNEIVGIIGRNGAGKTTLINTVSGVHRHYSGGIDFKDRSFKLRRYTVFAEDTSFQYYTFNEYLSHVFSAYDRTPNAERVEELVSGFRFANYRSVLIRDLSTGDRKKVYLIIGFALGLPILLLDEPVNGLDFQSTEYLYEQINSYRKYGTVLFSSHILESICLTSDRVLVLENGCISREFCAGQIDATVIREALNEQDT